MQFDLISKMFVFYEENVEEKCIVNALPQISSVRCAVFFTKYILQMYVGSVWQFMIIRRKVNGVYLM